MKFAKELGGLMVALVPETEAETETGTEHDKPKEDDVVGDGASTLS